MRHGYAVIVVERSGTGASTGVANLSHEFAAKEADEILNWIAAQRWCNGRIGMFGESFQAMVQFAAASSGNPHLKAIFPASSSFDSYGVTYSGGIYNEAFQSFFTWAMAFLERVVTPVDSDPDGRELARLLAERRGRTVSEQSVHFRDFPFRDSATSSGVQIWKEPAAIYLMIDRVNRANVPAYLSVGWYDIFTGDAFLLFGNLTVPKRLTVRPIDHSGADDNGADLDYAAEAHRWFDHWLKGIDNGIMAEPPLHYYVMGAPKEQRLASGRRLAAGGHQELDVVLRRRQERHDRLGERWRAEARGAKRAPRPPTPTAPTLRRAAARGRGGLRSTGRSNTPTCAPMMRRRSRSRASRWRATSKSWAIRSCISG